MGVFLMQWIQFSVWLIQMVSFQHTRIKFDQVSSGNIGLYAFFSIYEQHTPLFYIRFKLTWLSMKLIFLVFNTSSHSYFQQMWFPYFAFLIHVKNIFNTYILRHAISYYVSFFLHVSFYSTWAFTFFVLNMQQFIR